MASWEPVSLKSVFGEVAMGAVLLLAALSWEKIPQSDLYRLTTKPVFVGARSATTQSVRAILSPERAREQTDGPFPRLSLR